MTRVKVVRDILEANDRLASDNRAMFDTKGVRVLNLMSAPGAGKTSLLERTIAAMGAELSIGVVEGDIQGSHDAERIEAAGARSVQINTDGACHLDANMVASAVEELGIEGLDLLVVENVGNLVCPAEFNVGEHAKAMVLSLPEGDDKPAKYPLMFRESRALVINKMDLAPHVDADPDRIERAARDINPKIAVFRVSCKTGDGLDAWCAWLREL